MKHIKYLACFLFLCFLAAADQNSLLNQTIPSDLQKQLLGNSAGKNLSPEEISRLVQQQSTAVPDKRNIDDSTYSSDSTSESLNKSSTDSLTTYERIFLGDTLFPDSMLKHLSIFGLDLFSKARPSTFAPTENFSIPSDYVINTDDEIIILTWGRINEEHRLKVDRDGTINIPRIGPVSVSGLPFSVMKENILSRIKQIEGVSASISVGTLRTIGIFVVGEVKVPGFYTVSALSNITNALFAAGGPSKKGSLRNIQLVRNKKTVTTLDLYEFLLEGKDPSGFRLQPGDVIHIPLVNKMVAVTGNVRRSAFYEIKDNENLKNIISLAGGLTPSAWINTIQIDRFSNNEKQLVIDIDSLNSTIPSVPVQDGDIIKIFPILDKNKNAVYLTGNVVRPGMYEFENGLRIRDILPTYNALLPETYLEYAVIIRQDPPRYLNRIQTFNLKDAIDNPESVSNLFLQSRDYVIIYSLDYFEPDRNVEIGGSVTNSGKFKLLKNMKIRDLILQAGGLSDDASATRGELYRRRIDPDNDLVSTIKIDFCVECALKNDSLHNLSLNRLDRVFIRSKLGWEKERKVNLRGQFNFPGTYVLFEGETLGGLIDRAGGFNKDAYLAAAVFTRLSVKEFEQQRNLEYNRQLETDILNLSAEFASKDNPAEAQSILEQQLALKNSRLSKNASGRIVINLNDTKNYTDFILEDGDDLFVPRNLNTVSVLGEVYNPSTFKFEPNNSTVNYYLEAAGGAKSTADLKHLYIIKANGNIVTNKKQRVIDYDLSPGDAVVIPQKIKYTNPHKIFVDTVDSVFKISMLVGNLVTLILVIRSLK